MGSIEIGNSAPLHTMWDKSQHRVSAQTLLCQSLSQLWSNHLFGLSRGVLGHLGLPDHLAHVLQVHDILTSTSPTSTLLIVTGGLVQLQSTQWHGTHSQQDTHFTAKITICFAMVKKKDKMVHKACTFDYNYRSEFSRSAHQLNIYMKYELSSSAWASNGCWPYTVPLQQGPQCLLPCSMEMHQWGGHPYSCRHNSQCHTTSSVAPEPPSTSCPPGLGRPPLQMPSSRLQSPHRSLGKQGTHNTLHVLPLYAFTRSFRSSFPMY